jgi:mycothiol system anti-sigma-R factor
MSEQQEPASSVDGSPTRPASHNAQGDQRAVGATVTDCTETVMRIFEFLDGEMSPDDCRRMQTHLDECGPCLREYHVDQALKMVVKRSCGSETAPTELRTTILHRLTMVRIETGD